jgi:hypothetical protein
MKLTARKLNANDIALKSRGRTKRNNSDDNDDDDDDDDEIDAYDIDELKKTLQTAGAMT